MRSPIVSAMFALHPRGKFWSSFFKSLRVWAEPIKNSVFFLIAFSFALTVSKEKAEYGLAVVTNQGRFTNRSKTTKFDVLCRSAQCNHTYFPLLFLKNRGVEKEKIIKSFLSPRKIIPQQG